MKKWEVYCAFGVFMLALGLVLPLWIILSLYGTYKSFLDPDTFWVSLLGACLGEISVFCLRQANIMHKLEEKKEESHVTPKSFLKKCVKCYREIPIASEQCPYCGQKQP
jgi:hypothetical protein